MASGSTPAGSNVSTGAGDADIPARTAGADLLLLMPKRAICQMPRARRSRGHHQHDRQQLDQALGPRDPGHARISTRTSLPILAGRLESDSSSEAVLPMLPPRRRTGSPNPRVARRAGFPTYRRGCWDASATHHEREDPAGDCSALGWRRISVRRPLSTHSCSLSSRRSSSLESPCWVKARMRDSRRSRSRREPHGSRSMTGLRPGRVGPRSFPVLARQ